MNNTTTLEAVNDMLATIGEAPINSLQGDLTYDVTQAVTILNRVTRSVQNRGWGFNTDYDFTFATNLDGQIPMPDNVSHIEFKPEPSRDVVRRGKFAWDRKAQTSFFTQGVIASKVVWTFDFEDLPQAARDYISIRASREFAQKILGDQQAVQYTAVDEQQAWAKLRNDENRSEDNYFGVDRRITGRNAGC